VTYQKGRYQNQTALNALRESADVIVARVSLGQMGDHFDHIQQGRFRGGEIGLLEFAKFLAVISIKRNADAHFPKGPYAGLSRVSKVVAEADVVCLLKHTQEVREACWHAASLNATETPEENEIQGPDFLAAVQKLETAW
jgi:hypothetical protein